MGKGPAVSPVSEMADALLIKRLSTLIAVRAFFVTILLGSFFFFHIGYNIFPYPQYVNYVIIALYGLTIAYALLLEKVPLKPFAYVQFAFDIAASVTLIMATGGIESWFNSLPLLIVIAAAIVLDRRAGYAAAVVSSILYGSLIDLQYYQIIPVPYDPMHPEKDFFYNIFSHMVALFLTAYLIGHLLERLERKSSDYMDLSLFNREVIENTPSGLFTTDPGGKVQLFNRAAEEITRVGRAAAAGRHVGMVFPFLLMRNLEELSRLEERVEIGGERRTIGLSMSKMSDATGRMTGYIGVFQDLTEIKNMQEEIKRREKLEARGELSANIAHEIRNPLASLKSSIEMLREGGISDRKREKLMSIAVAEMDRLNNILTDFLDYSRPRQLDLGEFDLGASLRRGVELLRGACNGGVGITLVAAGPLQVLADEERLMQVFWNLGLNAIEAMPGGGTLSVSAFAKGEAIEIVFEDTGVGIDPADMERIFYPFFTTRKKGTGLGLSIANRIVSDHGGRISVRSRPGAGTRFSVTLPMGRKP